MPHLCVCANCDNIKEVAKNISLHTLPYYGNERPERKRRRKRWVDFVNPNAHTANLRRLQILQLLYCRARLFAFVVRCCVSYHGYLSLDPFFSIVGAYFNAVQCIKLRAKGRFSFGCVFVIAPLRSVTVRFVLRELNVFLLCFDYAIEWLGNSSVLLWPGAATSPLAVSKFCGILGNGRFRSLAV